jgi:enoyl-CoA hydratase
MIERTETNGIVTIKLAHGKASALDLELVEGLTLAIDELAQSDARAAILTGTGSIFSAGVDLFRILDGGEEYVKRFLPALSRLVLDLFGFEKPLVAATNGHAIAGGCVMTAACDIRLMARGNGRIGVPEMLVGVAFPPSVIELLRFTVEPFALQTMIYTGRTGSAEDAQRIGLIDEVVEPEALLDRAHVIAEQLAQLPAKAFRLAKFQLRDPYIRRAKRYAGQHDSDILELWSAPQTHTRIREYLEKTVRKS